MCSWLVWGQFRGLVCDCLWLASGPLYDLFESVIAGLRSDMFGCQYVCSNVLTCDEFLCANGHFMT